MHAALYCAAACLLCERPCFVVHDSGHPPPCLVDRLFLACPLQEQHLLPLTLLDQSVICVCACKHTKLARCRVARRLVEAHRRARTAAARRRRMQHGDAGAKQCPVFFLPSTFHQTKHQAALSTIAIETVLIDRSVVCGRTTRSTHRESKHIARDFLHRASPRPRHRHLAAAISSKREIWRSTCAPPRSQ